MSLVEFYVGGPTTKLGHFLTKRLGKVYLIIFLIKKKFVFNVFVLNFCISCSAVLTCATFRYNGPMDQLKMSHSNCKIDKIIFY